MLNSTSRKLLVAVAAVLLIAFFWSFLSVQNAYNSFLIRTGHDLWRTKDVDEFLASDESNVEDQNHQDAFVKSFPLGDESTRNQISEEEMDHPLTPVTTKELGNKDKTGQMLRPPTDDEWFRSGKYATANSLFPEATRVSSLPSTTPVAHIPPSPTPLILYAYSDSAWAYRNLEFFLTHGLHDAATFVFILNGALPDLDSRRKRKAAEGYTTNTIPESIAQAQSLLEKYSVKHSNIHIIPRPNSCYDLGAYGSVLLSNSSHYLTTHKKFIMLNASLRGPFIPFWSRECWSEAYLYPITSRMKDALGRTVKLVGMSMNCVQGVGLPRHIQSMVMATDDIGMKILLGIDPKSAPDLTSKFPGEVGLSKCPSSYTEAVNDVETQLTNLILDATDTERATKLNYTVQSMFSLGWSEKDYVDSCVNGDVNAYAGGYEGGNLNIWETMFIKTRWGVDKDQVERISGWLDQAMADGRRNGSWNVCASI